MAGRAIEIAATCAIAELTERRAEHPAADFAFCAVGGEDIHALCHRRGSSPV